MAGLSIPVGPELGDIIAQVANAATRLAAITIGGPTVLASALPATPGPAARQVRAGMPTLPATQGPAVNLTLNAARRLAAGIPSLPATQGPAGGGAGMGGGARRRTNRRAATKKSHRRRQHRN